MKVEFTHGLGDCVNFAHQIPLYKKRGYDIEVFCEDAMAPLMRAGGATILPERGAPYHPNVNPSRACPLRKKPWLCNKPTYMIGLPPMPVFPMSMDIFNEYANARIDMESECDGVTYDVGHDVIVLHCQGSNETENKNIDSLSGTLVDAVIDATGRDVVVIDHYGTWPDNARATKVKPATVQELYLLLKNAALFAGIDSGPLAMLRCTDTPGIGIWTNHHPVNFCVPRQNTLHLVDQTWDHYSIPWRIPYNIVRCGIDSGQIAEQIRRMLAPNRYFTDSAADTQFQQFIEWTTGATGALGYIDRGKTFNVMFDFLSRKESPTIVETGTIRAQDDFHGAGYSTYLFGIWVSHNGGTLHTVDISEGSLAFAERELHFCDGDIHYHNMRGIDYLAKCGPIDLFYSDGEDLESPTHAEGCLDECKRASRHVVGDGIIAIDDTVLRDGSWVGKGRLAVPWLLDNGWVVVEQGYQVVLRRNDT